VHRFWNHRNMMGETKVQSSSVSVGDLLELRQQIREDTTNIFHDMDKRLMGSWTYWWDQVHQPKLVDTLRIHQHEAHLHATEEMRCAVDGIVGELLEHCGPKGAPEGLGPSVMQDPQMPLEDPKSFQEEYLRSPVTEPTSCDLQGTSRPLGVIQQPLNDASTNDLSGITRVLCGSGTDQVSRSQILPRSGFSLELNSQGPNGAKNNADLEQSHGLAYLREKAGKILRGPIDSHEDLTLCWLREPVIAQPQVRLIEKCEAAPSFFQSTVKPLIDSSVFDAISCLIILANAIFVGVFMEKKLKSVRHQLPRLEDEVVKENVELGTPDFFAYVVVEYLFNVLFLLEFCLRLFAHGRRFRLTTELSWLIFDAALLVACIIDVSMGSEDGNSIVLLFRLARIVRIFRVLRPVRKMPIFRDLRMIVVGTFKSARTLLWAFVCLTVTLYVFSIVFLEGVYGYFRRCEYISLSEVDRDVYAGLSEFFGSLEMSMTSLFMAVSGGLDWEVFWKVMAAIGPFYGYMFVGYVMITLHGLLNVVTGIFVDSAMILAKNDEHLASQEDRESRKAYIHHMRRILSDADADGSGTITWNEFEDHLHDAKLRRYFLMWGLDVAEAKHIFRILDEDNSGEVSIEDFLAGCYRLKGEARKLDMTVLMYENKKMADKWARFLTFSMQEFEHIRRSIESLSARLSVAVEEAVNTQAAV